MDLEPFGSVGSGSSTGSDLLTSNVLQSYLKGSVMDPDPVRSGTLGSASVKNYSGSGHFQIRNDLEMKLV
jgi:hypothetical protein